MTIPLLMLLQASGEELYQAGRFAEARDALELEVRSATASAQTYFWLGYAELALGNKPGAIQPFEIYLKTNPKDEDVLYAVARTYAQLGDKSRRAQSGDGGDAGMDQPANGRPQCHP